jgi:hypothetical protein
MPFTKLHDFIVETFGIERGGIQETFSAVFIAQDVDDKVFSSHIGTPYEARSSGTGIINIIIIFLFIGGTCCVTILPEKEKHFGISGHTRNVDGVVRAVRRRNAIGNALGMHCSRTPPAPQE